MLTAKSKNGRFTYGRELPAGPGPLLNALTVDVEDYFHAAALSSVLPRSSWETCEARVVENTRRALDLFESANVTGTFFILGSVARTFPDLVRAIVAGGHEVASHGDAHFRVSDQSPKIFASDVTASKHALEDIAGQEVVGYRAANFSINRDTWWAFEILEECGYRYSSSINPVVHDHYGVPGGPRFAFVPTKGSIVEFPITTVEIAGRRLAAGGGGYFRLVPYSVFRWAISRVNARDRQPAIFYFHPWEIDPGQPRVPVRGLSRFRHYINLDVMEGKIRRLLSDFKWSRLDRVYANVLAGQRPAADAMPPDNPASASRSALRNVRGTAC